MRTADEHTKLARAALDFYPDLDSDFQINVAKVRVALPSELKERLQEPVERLAKRARTVYDQKEGAAHTKATAASPNGSARSGYAGTNAKSNGSESPAASYADSMDAAATAIGERPALRRIVKRLKDDSPEVARALGW